MISSGEQRLQHDLRGSITLFPWCQRGRMTLRISGLPSSPKGGIVGIMIHVWNYGTGVVLDGNSLKWQISAQALKIIENELPIGDPKKSCGHAGAPNKKCGHTHRYSIQKVWTSNSLTPTWYFVQALVPEENDIWLVCAWSLNAWQDSLKCWLHLYTEDRDRWSTSDLHILQCLHHPKKLCATRCGSHILCFSCR